MINNTPITLCENDKYIYIYKSMYLAVFAWGTYSALQLFVYSCYIMLLVRLLSSQLSCTLDGTRTFLRELVWKCHHALSRVLSTSLGDIFVAYNVAGVASAPPQRATGQVDIDPRVLIDVIFTDVQNILSVCVLGTRMCRWNIGDYQCF